MKHKFDIGSKYIIEFRDHCLGDFNVICEVMIKLTKQDKDMIYGTWWIVKTDDKEVEESNREMISIIKSTVIKKRKIK